MSAIKKILISSLLLAISNSAIAAGWNTFTFSDMNDVVRVDISAPGALVDLALDNLVVTGATIGFEGVVADDANIIPGAPHAESGYTLTANPTGGSDGIFGKNFDGGGFGNNSNGSAIFGWCSEFCFGSEIVLSLVKDGDVPFNFHSMGAALLSRLEAAASGPVPYDIVGVFADGSTVTHRILVNQHTTIAVPANSLLMLLIMILALAASGMWFFRRVN